MASGAGDAWSEQILECGGSKGEEEEHRRRRVFSFLRWLPPQARPAGRKPMRCVAKSAARRTSCTPLPCPAGPSAVSKSSRPQGLLPRSALKVREVMLEGRCAAPETGAARCPAHGQWQWGMADPREQSEDRWKGTRLRRENVSHNVLVALSKRRARAVRAHAGCNFLTAMLSVFVTQS